MHRFESGQRPIRGFRIRAGDSEDRGGNEQRRAIPCRKGRRVTRLAGEKRLMRGPETCPRGRGQRRIDGGEPARTPDRGSRAALGMNLRQPRNTHVGRGRRVELGALVQPTGPRRLIGERTPQLPAHPAIVLISARQEQQHD